MLPLSAMTLWLLLVSGGGPAQAILPILKEYQSVKSDNLAPFPKWTKMIARQHAEKGEDFETCLDDEETCRLTQWRELLGSLKGKSPRVQVEAVNRFVNKQPYVEDRDNWGIGDYWATPYEFFTGDGDCEDFAIAKFFSLRELGIPKDKMRILIVQDFNLGGIMHAVLEVNLDGQALILDNQVPQVRPLARIYHYHPIYSINEAAWWAYRY